VLAGRVRDIDLQGRRGAFDAATHAEIDGLSLIADECIVKPGAQIVNSVLGPGVHLEERARVENSVVWAHTRVGAGARLSHAVVGRGCHIGREAAVGPGAVLGDKTSLTDYTQTGAGT
jgi:ADP-glucose pyrophosphorylase